MSVRRARVSLDGRLAGWLAESDDGRETTFVYDQAWLALPDATPVSLTIPLSAEPVVTRGLHPFFENLLPEGWLLELSTAKFRISKDDIFGVLLATCADTVGAVEITPAEAAEPATEESPS